MTDYLTPDEAGELRGVHPETVRRILRDEERRRVCFPNAIRIGGPHRGAWLIPRADVEQWEPNPPQGGRPPNP